MGSFAVRSAITGHEGFVDDLGDQLECVLGAEPEADERDVGVLPRGHRADLFDVDLACNHLVAESRHDLCEQLESIPPLVRDQDAERRERVLDQWLGSNTQNQTILAPFRRRRTGA